MMRKAKERAVKAALVRQLASSRRVDVREVAEWLWEDFGVKVKPDWRHVERAIMREDDITPQDVAVFMLEAGIEPDEGAWDAAPRPALRGGKEDSGGDRPG